MNASAEAAASNKLPVAPNAPAVVPFWLSVLGSILSSVLTAVLILGLSLYLAVVGENQPGAVLRELSPQVQLVPDAVFGTVPGTVDGRPLVRRAQTTMLADGYTICGGRKFGVGSETSAFARFHPERYQFQAYSCQSQAYEPHPLRQLQAVLFFWNGSYLGADSSQPSFRPIIIGRTADTIVVEYNLFHWDGAGYQATGGTQIVRFQLADDRKSVEPEDPFPPVATPDRDGR